MIASIKNVPICSLTDTIVTGAASWVSRRGTDAPAATKTARPLTNSIDNISKKENNVNEDIHYEGQAETYDPDQITSFGKFLGIGREAARLVTIEAKLSTKRKWMLEAKFEIAEGDNEGFERKLRYPLGIVKWEKNGRSGIAAGGIADMKRDLNNIGRPWTKEDGQFSNQPDEAYATNIARIYNKKMGGGQLVELHTVWDKESPIMEDDPEKPGEQRQKKNEKGETMYWTRTSVTGLAGARRNVGPGEATAASRVDALLKA